ncbi:hypothetical protein TraAM80_06645 [Trypanosoma rangeli]|uniref:Uncharacterized protein n=1 Tax=Trypanosoma rangeli TaxID=5698 RepID=A0A422N989_TRYRA|nr:uncharacterized protein TraAM80_06645 [Trypanosoma rangeli]RNF02030.1 hypothetical protein TraAM80_06645 [Trypanosoma rangeli]|eukprot:RNF02030.1 hypothetical protein TraAM80_06645 [Trypanosoma rangeli]
MWWSIVFRSSHNAALCVAPSPPYTWLSGSYSRNVASVIKCISFVSVIFCRLIIEKSSTSNAPFTAVKGLPIDAVDGPRAAASAPQSPPTCPSTKASARRRVGPVHYTPPPTPPRTPA